MKRVVVFLIAIFAFAAIAAQDTVTTHSVERSFDKVKVDGNLYYIHIVKVGDTLYAISKAYNVSQSEIAACNPDIYNGLQVGQALKIPAKLAESNGDDKYIYHIVKKKETLFGLSKQYNVSIDEIVKINPDTKEGLQLSQVILIPRFKEPVAELKPVKDSLNFIVHKVQPKEGLFAIARKYGVSKEEIELYNKDVLTDGLKLGALLRIPVKMAADSAHAATPTPILVAGKQEEEKKTVCKPGYVYNGEPFNIAIFLPFTQSEEGEYDSAIEDAVEQNLDAKPKSAERAKKHFSQVTTASLEFYEGFLIAVDSMKRAGISVNLSVFDTKRKKSEVEGLLHKGLPARTDLIVGSFLIDDLKPIAAYAAKNGINLVSPLYNGPTGLPQTPNIIAVNQSFKKQLEIFVENFKFEDTCKYIVVYDKENLYSSTIKHFDSLLTKKVPGNISLKKVYRQTATSKASEIQDSMMRNLSADKQNIVIIPSEDEPFVSEFLGHLYGVKSFYNFRAAVYGPSRWQKMKNIPSDYFYKLDIHVFTPFYVDYSRSNVKHFIADYRELYRAEPTQHAYLGYDVGLYFITALKNYGTGFNECLHNHRVDLLQSDFLFEGLNPLGSFQNTKQFMINYTSDFNVVKVK